MTRYSTEKRSLNFKAFKNSPTHFKMWSLMYFSCLLIPFISILFSIVYFDIKLSVVEILQGISVLILFTSIGLLEFKYRLVNRFLNLLFLKNGKHIFELVPISLYLKYGIITCLFYGIVRPRAIPIDTPSTYLQSYGAYFILGLFMLDVVFANFPSRKNQSSNNL
ncbi:MAG: hypothetical protein IPJ81_06445 [Chitinophagaceae bacterium]|nr:hypothetical protein [Chitinophagaceae bacterium]